MRIKLLPRVRGADLCHRRRRNRIRIWWKIVEDLEPVADGRGLVRRNPDELAGVVDLSEVLLNPSMRKWGKIRNRGCIHKQTYANLTKIS